MRLSWIFWCFIGFVLYSCKKDNLSDSAVTTNILDMPAWFPVIQYPEDNEYTSERWSLGKKLFYEKKLSKSQSFSCASCHKQEYAFSDNVAFSKGENNLIGTINAPSLFNLAYHPYYTSAGGVPTIEMQVLVPIQEHNEFDFNIVEISERLKEDTLYNKLSFSAYGREMSPYVITRAIANFERTLISGNSKFDFYYYLNREDVMSEEEKKGMELFYSDKTNCSKCHSGFNFTNYEFKNNGLFEVYSNEGRMRLTKMEEDRALFKIPSLRNVELTSPYMHNGMFVSLEEVVEHYNSGGKPHPNKSDLLKPLNLTYDEKRNLVLFLKTLTDKQFVNNPKFK